MGILDIEIVKGFMRMCNDGWLQGWHERNGGNLTYRMKEEEVAQCRPFFDPQPREWMNMGVQAAAARGDVAAAMKDNPALVAMMERAMQRMTIESMLMQAGTSEEDVKQLNRVLQGISKAQQNRAYNG